MEYEGCYYIKFKMEKGDGEKLIRHLYDKMKKEGIDLESLVSPSENPVFEKYDHLIPSSILRKAYISDRLRTDELIWAIKEMMREYDD